MGRASAGVRQANRIAAGTKRMERFQATISAKIAAAAPLVVGDNTKVRGAKLTYSQWASESSRVEKMKLDEMKKEYTSKFGQPPKAWSEGSRDEQAASFGSGLIRALTGGFQQAFTYGQEKRARFFDSQGKSDRAMTIRKANRYDSTRGR